MKTEAEGSSGTLPPTKLHGVISEKTIILIYASYWRKLLKYLIIIEAVFNCSVIAQSV
jgi:hypothetical protein